MDPFDPHCIMYLIDPSWLISHLWFQWEHIWSQCSLHDLHSNGYPSLLFDTWSHAGCPKGLQWWWHWCHWLPWIQADPIVWLIQLLIPDGSTSSMAWCTLIAFQDISSFSDDKWVDATLIWWSSYWVMNLIDPIKTIDDSFHWSLFFWYPPSSKLPSQLCDVLLYSIL